MKKKIFYVMAALVAAVLLSSCSKAPQAEIDQANAVIDSAKAVGADIYVPEAFAAVKDSMNAVMIMIEEQDSKLIKSYADSKEKLAQISVMAREVAVQSETRKEEIKTETLAILSEVKSLLEENKQLISQAPRGKEGTAALQAMKNELNVIETSVAEVEGMFAEGDWLACHSKASAAKEKAQMMNTELTEVIAKYTRARK